MRLLRSWLVRLFGLFSRRRSDAEFAAELESHLQLHIDEGIRAGLTPAEARRAALLELGPVEALRESYRDQSLIPGIAGAARDVRFGLRMLRRQPGFALTAIATLALGIGVNTAIFSIVDAVLLRPLPYSRPERIVEITGGGQGFVRFGPVLDVSPRTLKESPAFSSVGLYVAGGVNLGGDAAERVAAAAVTPGFFDVLGVKPALGRTFSDQDIAASGRIAVISDRRARPLPGRRGHHRRRRARRQASESGAAVRARAVRAACRGSPDLRSGLPRDPCGSRSGRARTGYPVRCGADRRGPGALQHPVVRRDPRGAAHRATAGDDHDGGLRRAGVRPVSVTPTSPRPTGIWRRASSVSRSWRSCWMPGWTSSRTTLRPPSRRPSRGSTSRDLGVDIVKILAPELDCLSADV